jgi:hypothetical protein
MQSTELSFELSAQELVDPNTAVSEPIEFDDLDTVLTPVAAPANEDAAVFSPDIEIEIEADVELELEADDIDALLSTSFKT